jgi:hypothetical protein
LESLSECSIEPPGSINHLVYFTLITKLLIPIINLVCLHALKTSKAYYVMHFGECVIYPFKWLLSLPSNTPTIKLYKRLKPGLIHYDHLINAEIISALSIQLTLLKN